MVVYCVSDFKGGVSKSSTATITASILQQMGKKVLLLDADMQCNSTDCYRAQVDGVGTLYDVILYHDDPLPIADAIQHTESGDIVAGDPLLRNGDLEFLHDSGGTYYEEEFYRLQKALKGLKGYDYVIIDTAPADTMLLRVCLDASDFVIIPTIPDRYSLSGLSEINRVITEEKELRNPDLSISGILLTRYKPQQQLAREVKKSLESIAVKMNTKVFDTYIRESVAVQKAQAMRIPLLEYDDACNAAQDYKNFVKELIGGDKR